MSRASWVSKGFHLCLTPLLPSFVIFKTTRTAAGVLTSWMESLTEGWGGGLPQTAH